MQKAKDITGAPVPAFLSLAACNDRCAVFRPGCNAISVQKVAPSLFATGVGDAKAAGFICVRAQSDLCVVG